MPELSPAAACEIIEAARAFHAKEELSSADEVSDDRLLDGSLLAGYEDDPDYAALKTLIDHLDTGQQIALVALMWLGRGDYDDFDAAAAEAARGWTPRTAEYLIATPLVADYLAEGLARAGYSCED